MFHLIGTYDLEVSLNGGTPKSSIYKWILHHKPSILGIPILGNPNLNILKAQWQNLKMTHMYHLFDLLWFGDWLYHIIYHIYNIYIPPGHSGHLSQLVKGKHVFEHHSLWPRTL